jgi:hypothetical protein
MPAARSASAPAVLAGLLTLSAAAEPLPPGVQEALARSYPGRTVAAWCRAAAGKDGAAFAGVALSGAAGGGDYLGVHPDGTLSALAAYTGQPQVACHTSASARALGRSTRDTPTVHGDLAVRGRGVVICGFVEATQARCWQYVAKRRRFVPVGGWIT